MGMYPKSKKEYNCEDPQIRHDFKRYCFEGIFFFKLEDILEYIIDTDFKMKSANNIKISIIIVNHNGKKFIKRMVQTALDQLYKPFEVIVVDTQSTDNTLDYITKIFPYIKTLSVKNNGFGFAVNEGVKKAKGDFVMFFNEDMYIPRNFIKSLVEYRQKLMRHRNNIGAIGCKIIPFDSNPSMTPAYLGGKIDLLGFPTDVKNPKEIPFIINGAPFFIQKKLFQKTGGFNPHIFLYGEDEDICWRLNIFGYNNFICNDTYLFHLGGGVINKNKERKVANVLASPVIPMLTNYSTLMLLLILPVYAIFFALINIGIFIATKFNLNYNIEIMKVYLNIIKNIPELLKFRFWVQNNRKINDFTILKKFSFIPSIIRNLSYKRLIKINLT